MIEDLSLEVGHTDIKSKLEAIVYLKHAAFLLEHGAEFLDGGIFFRDDYDRIYLDITIDMPAA